MRRIVVLDPFRGVWVRILFVTVLYVVLELPVDFAFNLPDYPWCARPPHAPQPSDSRPNATRAVFDALVIVFFWLDILVNFYAAYRNDEYEVRPSP